MSDDYYKAVNDCAESQGVPSGDTSKYLKLVKDNIMYKYLKYFILFYLFITQAKE